MKNKRVAFLCALLILVFSVRSEVKATPTLESLQQESEHDGFLVSINQDYWEEYLTLPMVLPVLAEIEKISEPLRILRVPDLIVLSELFPEEAIQYIEPNYQVKLSENHEINPLTSLPRNWNLAQISMEESEKNYSGEGIRVAVIDTGIDPNHPDLNYDKIEAGWNYFHNSEDTADIHGHGTFVLGVLAAIPNNGIGSDGAIPWVTLVPLKVTDDKGNSTTATLISALQDAVEKYNCEVINISIGMRANSIALEEAIESLPDKVILIASAGNDGKSLYQYPASYSRVVSVGSVNYEQQISSFSQINDQITIVAPGEDVFGLAKSTEGAPYRILGSGTSFAAPHVTAAAAMAKQAIPGLTAADFRVALTQTAKDLGEVGFDNTYGFGLLQVDYMIDCLIKTRMEIAEKSTDVIIEKEEELSSSPERYNPCKSKSMKLIFAAHEFSFKIQHKPWINILAKEHISCCVTSQILIIEKTEKIKQTFLEPIKSLFGSKIPTKESFFKKTKS